MKLVNRALKFMAEHSDRLAQSLNKTVLGEPVIREEMSRLCRQAAAEGIVVLKNQGILPLHKDARTAFFGRIQNNYFYVGYGSGGDVNPTYRISPMDAIRSRKDIAYCEELADSYRRWCEENPPFEGTWGTWPTCFDEMPLTDQRIRRAAETATTAVVFIGRAMGESLDNKPKKGYYYLTDQEKDLLDRVTGVFSEVAVVVDAGNVIDLSWVKGYGDRIGALVYAWQGGMESGNAVVDVLYGDVNPSGKLTDTIALNYGDYPAAKNFGKALYNNYAEDIYVGYRYFETFARDKVLYPFGFGLSYTTFSIESEMDHNQISVTVENTGNRSGAQVVQLYVCPPQGKLGKPLRNLIAFEKTRVLEPGERQTVVFGVTESQLASYDDSGVTGYPYCDVVEAGEYRFYVGTDVASAEYAGSLEIRQLLVAARHQSCAGAARSFLRMKPDAAGKLSWEKVPLGKQERKLDVLGHLPQGIPITGDHGIQLEDVKSGHATLDEFVAQLDVAELDAITRGEGKMGSSLGVAGNAGILGGTTESLRRKGVPVITTTDGPSGIRVSYHTSLLPCGTALGSTWNPKLIEKLGGLFGEEMAQTGSDILLGPGMNIHRDPMCGRNFEYYSEDPLLTGKIAAAMVRGIQSVPGRSACPKHFACNNQEWMRSRNDSRLSERALREIYLRGFEICVKESAPHTIMTSYNKINGVWGHYHYDLVTNILRGEWGFQGLVITDWWMQPSVDPDFPRLHNDAYRIRAQVDVLMPGGVRQSSANGDGSLVKSYRQSGGITLGEMQRCAKNVLKLCLKLK